MLVPLTGNHKPFPYLKTSFNERSGRISPDGHSVAYISDESGQHEVYIQSFPQPGNKIRISAKGGTYPEWSEDGKRLYFLSSDPNDGKTWMVFADLRSPGSVPRNLFEVPPGYRDLGRSAYAVFDNGRRFLISVLAPDTAPHTITIGLNWPAALKK